MEYALRFNFEATNNEAEYEALGVGLELVRSLSVRQILMRGDSKLIGDQIREDCGIKNESLIKYHAKATTLAKDFTHIVFEHIPRTENEEVDRLSKLATTYYCELPKEIYVETPLRRGKSSKEVSDFACRRESCTGNPSRDHCGSVYLKKRSQKCYMKCTTAGVAATSGEGL
ncbi:hypothetical protein LIER_20183 [Lithospermum erythrorhizon]|uniref:RNase H type-1 domain-containing protein n=1 Tax=Lithospermum erythrorhizon TaxID=34254 RepID=A0AAV3QKI9_LITER